ncbi:uncharacterized protein [Lolium perenne]|uniref:uncharacterized protein n=1 Tax=Lolium perenne TaxID=4522 RepID=UPI0021F5FE67|nr:uncharacterized protein LOC127329282 [Lolium perenne]
MPLRANQTGFTGVRLRPSGRFYEDICDASSSRHSTRRSSARAYTAAWRLGHPATTFNFRDCHTLAEAEFMAGVSMNLVNNEQRRHHRQCHSIVEVDEHAMEVWCQAFLQDALDKEAFYTQKRAEREAETAAKMALKMEVR